MIASREWIAPSDDEVDDLLAELYAPNPTTKPPVAISIMPRPEDTGYFVLVDEDLKIVGLFGLEAAVGLGWVVGACKT